MAPFGRVDRISSNLFQPDYQWDVSLLCLADQLYYLTFRRFNCFECLQVSAFLMEEKKHKHQIYYEDFLAAVTWAKSWCTRA